MSEIKKEISTTEPKALVPNGGYKMHTFEEFRDLYYTYIKNPKDREMVAKAYRFAKSQHEGVFRKSGEPYIQHPLEVAYILAELQGGPETLASGFLHDVVEDTETTVEDIKREFTPDVAMIVDALTKIQRMKLSHRTEQDFEAEDHKKIFLGMARDVRVILVKLADRLHNLRTLDALKPERQHALSQETLDVFTPIAHRLGIYKMQSEMEDLSLKYLEPEKYAEILNLLNAREENRQESLRALQKRIADLLFENKIQFRIESRVKSIYSIYRKMYQKNHSFDELYDILAVRIITDTVLNCYTILGTIHATYKPIPGRFKDYIATPKPNLYQSLHTSIISGDGNVYEVQIRTEEMDEVAESGVAAHWRYKDGGNYNAQAEQKDIEEKLHWFRDFVSMSNATSDTNAKEYIEALEHDVFNANVYVFTPLGKVIDLPAGATVLDFAYRIHTKVAESAVGAIVNGAHCSLSTTLKTGDVCEIRTVKNASGPNPSWLDIAQTSGAKAHIRRFLQKKNEYLKEEIIEKGKENALEAFASQGIGSGEMEKYLNDPVLMEHFGAKSLENLYELIANRNPAPFALIDYLGIRKKKSQSFTKNLVSNVKNDADTPIIVEGADNLHITMGKCCTPVPGDEIVGYVVNGKGIVVHRENCPNLLKSKPRLIPVSWNKNLGKTAKFPVMVRISANDRSNLLVDLMGVLSSKGILVTDLKIHLAPKTMHDIVNLTIYVPDKETIATVFQAIQEVKGVYSCERVMK
ncbi:MAG: bifunctional (p)ppGpp synthetase/guanosine-3',5'-bis(diphosphate) 3'-pyrophosphohydrolase [Bacilli bacterium]|nr:bifunctional (p)ppGpp synthetase/guanosine-3',5'-bis(diphosphate) 3'-pyrophosphohydrolase [Bacilli bacterium]